MVLFNTKQETRDRKYTDKLVDFVFNTSDNTIHIFGFIVNFVFNVDVNVDFDFNVDVDVDVDVDFDVDGIQ